MLFNHSTSPSDFNWHPRNDVKKFCCWQFQSSLQTGRCSCESPYALTDGIGKSSENVKFEKCFKQSVVQHVWLVHRNHKNLLPVLFHSGSPWMAEAESGRNQNSQDPAAHWWFHFCAQMLIICSDPNEARTVCAKTWSSFLLPAFFS